MTTSRCFDGCRVSHMRCSWSSTGWERSPTSPCDFSRRRTYDQNLDPVPATITKTECSDILTRTVDWISQEYGVLAANRSKGSGDIVTKTAKGNPYWIERTSDEKGYVATGTAKMIGGRSVDLFSNFLVLDGEPDCHIAVSFEDAQQVERRRPKPETQAELDQITGKTPHSAAQDASRFPFGASDGVDVTSEEDERNWKRYGTTQPDWGE